ncbi:hypothetical protein PIIN_09551 [Serendipita indica DSM 11827]|uniref:Uncharacterized protein n=1 Tax=Serendipita indica (strain DSM 11827) TaxID=1109443 RepID=G4TW68_SERID|nr:hypothetical protein PIIN_09551 [Serendipita indica DSM 11827]
MHPNPQYYQLLLIHLLRDEFDVTLGGMPPPVPLQVNRGMQSTAALFVHYQASLPSNTSRTVFCQRTRHRTRWYGSSSPKGAHPAGRQNDSELT